jgi:molybdopterin/thiamine biosynthesis adenylyltransferase
MSQQQINLSSDLKRLRDEGYNIELNGNGQFLLLKDVPYVTASKQSKLAILISKLDWAGNTTTKPSDHVINFVGDYPCDMHGSEIGQFRHVSTRTELDKGIWSDHSFSSKPKDKDGYRDYIDYYEKMTTYAKIIAGPALAINPELTLTPFKAIASDCEVSAFNYVDTSSSRAGTSVLSRKVEDEKVGIIGLGGTGSYILDLVAKNPVKEIALFDRDLFSQHNAFRSPGAASMNDLNKRQTKVDYFNGIYSNMHRNIKSHNTFIDQSNIELLSGLTFVFICIDNGEAKKLIIDKLNEHNIECIDVGIGLDLCDDKLSGHVRVTTITPEKRDHIKNKVSFANTGGDVYTKNIQLAVVNSFNASAAVFKWLKIRKIFVDFENEHSSLYSINTNKFLNDDFV